MLPAILLVAGLCALGLILFLYRPRVKPLWFLCALVSSAAALALAAFGMRQGLVLVRYAAPPEATVNAFFSQIVRGDYAAARALMDGSPALGLENTPEDELGAALLDALRQSYSFRLIGAAGTQGLRAEQEVELCSLDLAALLADGREKVLSRLETLVAERTYREVYDEQGAYRPEITDEAWQWAVRELLEDAGAYRKSETLRLSLRYDEALSAALGGAPGSFETELHNGKSRALDGLVFIRKRYQIPEGTLAPAPDPSRYGSSRDPAAVRAVVDGAAILLDGQATVWNEEIELFPDTEFSWYYDDSILAICWKELIGGKCCTFAEVKLADGSQLQHKITDDTYDSRRREYGSRLAEEAHAVVASNGDFYAFRPYGITVWRRQLYRCELTHLDACFITAGGDMLMAPKKSFASQQDVENYIADNDVVFSLAFGPILIRDGELQPVTDYLVGEVREDYSRSLLGMTGELHYLVMTVNFDKNVFHTAKLAEAQRILYDKGCVQGYALDGGQTAEIWMNGTILNHVDWGSERPVSDMLCFVSAVPEEGRAP